MTRRRPIKVLGVLDRKGQYPRLIGGKVCVGVERFPGSSKQSQRYVFLTRQQKQVLTFLADGLCIKQVGARLNVTQKTAEYHRARLYQMLGVSGIAELTKIACRLKLSAL